MSQRVRSTKFQVLWLFFVGLSLSGQGAIAQESAQIFPLTIGQTITFKSSVLNEERRLNVYLPASYERQSASRYPVIYLLDGSLDEDFIHIVGLVQFGSFSWINMVPESIVVGIANVDRKRDFTSPSNNERDNTELPTSGGSARFIKALGQEILPLITQRYRTNGQETIIGQSLGGLIATQILYQHSGLFDNYIIVSPSLWWDDESLLKSEPPKFDKPTGVFVGVGKEGEVMERVAKELHANLNTAANERLSVSFEYFPALDHGDTLHLAVYSALEALFSSRQAKH